tara:strand:+ start:5134 stop:5901 length:768 start_codon:yes stop_codon:yes gene_type:complete
MLSSASKKDLLSLVSELGKEAELIRKSNIEIELKEDSSPITKADLLINEELNKFFSSTQFKNIISEENAEVPYKERKKWEIFWCIDPIDGTKEYISGGSDYTINIALCKKDRPIFSIVYAPAREELFVAEKDQGATKNGTKIVIDRKISSLVHLVASKSHLNKKTEDYIEKISSGHNVNLLQFGSSLKICKIAEGAAHLYPRFGPTMEWDTCAADLVLTEAGGFLVDMQKNKLLYNKQNLLNPYFISSVSKKLIL